MSKGGGGGNTTTVQKADPWSDQQPYLRAGFSQAQSEFFDPQTGFGGGSYHPQYFDQGQAGVPSSYNAAGTVAGFTPWQNAGLNNMVGTASHNQDELSPLLDSNSIMGRFGSLNASNPGNNVFSASAANGGTGNATLADYASGKMLGTQNPAWQQLSQSVAASTVPQLEGQFTQGGAMNNPNAQYSIANGLGSALAPYAEQNYLTQTQNQIGAANTLAGNALTAGQGLSGNYNTGNQQAIQSQFAAPGLYSASMGQASVPFEAGAAQQTQNQAQLSDLVNRWNYNQNLPLNMLNAYQSTINGNFGGTQTLTQPYFQNGLANALGTGMGALGLYNMGSQAGLWGSLGGMFGGGSAAAGGASGLSDLMGTMAMLA